jgi:pimeloyl-ACP methyl ester carboxylesterase
MTLEQARAWQKAHYDISWYDGLQKTDYTVSSDDGYVLHAQLIQNTIPTNRYVIISHGYTDNRFGTLKYAKMYLDLGFNVIIYDQRGHGENEPTFCTYSARERKDLQALVEDARARYENMTILGLHGESLGAATSVAVLQYKPEVDFVVADCGFSNIKEILMSGGRLPGWMIDIVSLCAKLRYGYSYGEMRPVDCLAENQVPICFIHGAEDTFIPPKHSEEMKAATKGYRELHIMDGANHAQSVLVNPKEYKKIVELFIGRIDPSIL